MIEVAVFFILFVFLTLKPSIIPYLALLYLFALGLIGREAIDFFKVSLGHVNVFPLDLLYVLASIYSLVYLIKSIFNAGFKKLIAQETMRTTVFIWLFIFFYIGKLVNGFFNSMPLDTLVRLFMTDTQVLYFFLPLVMYRDVSQLKRLIRFAVTLSLIFPLCQPLLTHTEMTLRIMKGQGTFRLGYGDANILLSFGVIALFCWEYKKYLASLPLAGILMLAHRSAYIAIVLSVMAVSFLKGKNIKNIMMLGVAGLLVIGMLAALQEFTNINLLDKNLNRAGETFKATGTTKARVNVIVIAIDEFQKRPFTGLGYKEIQKATDNSKYDSRDFNITHPHNFILSSIMHTGLIGTFLLFMLIFNSFKASYKLAQVDAFRNQGVYLFSSILFFVIFSIMNTTMSAEGYIFWFLCGVAFWFLNQHKANLLKL